MSLSQEYLLLTLLKKASKTEFGKIHQFDQIQSFQAFQSRVPLQSYQTLEPFIEKVKSGEKDVLWPGSVQYIAVSSGTTGKGKHIPITADRLLSDKKYQHRIFSRLIPFPPLWSVFKGKVLSMPGGLERVENETNKYHIGEITGITAIRIASWIENLQVIGVKKLTLMNWEEKFAKVLHESIKSDVRVIVGAPTWIAEILRQAKLVSKKAIPKLWPNLNLIISGGVAYSHYKSQIEDLLEGKSVSILEMYGASEGYLGLSRVNDIGWFDLQLNQGMVYEFENLENGTINTIDSIKTEVDYSIRISSNTGLWRYPLKDRVRFNDKNQCELIGRLNSVSDYFGEYVTKEEVVLALEAVNIIPTRIVIAPFSDKKEKKIIVFIGENSQKKFEEFHERESKVDEKLREFNRHYDIRRQTNTLQKLQLRNWDEGIEQKYLNLIQNKAQQKIPDIITDIKISEFLLKNLELSD